MVRNAALLLLLGWLGAAALAQQNLAIGPANCLISGRLINVTTGQPLPHVLILMVKPMGPKFPHALKGVGAMTGAGGHFKARPLLPGRYLVRGWHYDSVRQSYVRSSTYGREAVLTLRPGQKQSPNRFHFAAAGWTLSFREHRPGFLRHRGRSICSEPARRSRRDPDVFQRQGHIQGRSPGLKRNRERALAFLVTKATVLRDHALVLRQEESREGAVPVH